MTYTFTEHRGAIIVQAKLETAEHFNELIKRLLDKRQQVYPLAGPVDITHKNRKEEAK